MRHCELREIQCLVCSTLHQMFIMEPKLVKLVHFQVKVKVKEWFNKAGNILQKQNYFGFVFEYFTCLIQIHGILPNQIRIAAFLKVC